MIELSLINISDTKIRQTFSCPQCKNHMHTGEGSVVKQYKALTRNPEVWSSSPLPTSHSGVCSLLDSLPVSWDF